MKVTFVGAGSGDPDLLTVKAQRLLAAARCCIYAGSLVAPAILEALPQDCEKHDSAEMDLDQIITVIRSCAERQTDVVRLHTGEPAIYGAIGEQMRRLDELGIEYDVVPGISSFQAAAAALKVELTAPEISQTVILTRTSGRTPVPADQELVKLAASRATLCIFLSAGKIAEVCAQLTPYYGGDCPAAMVYHASWPDQRVETGTLDDLPSRCEGIQRTAMILVGRAIGREGSDSRLYDRDFSHGYRQGSQP